MLLGMTSRRAEKLFLTIAAHKGLRGGWKQPRLPYSSRVRRCAKCWSQSRDTDRAWPGKVKKTTRWMRKGIFLPPGPAIPYQFERYHTTRAVQTAIWDDVQGWVILIERRWAWNGLGSCCFHREIFSEVLCNAVHRAGTEKVGGIRSSVGPAWCDSPCFRLRSDTWMCIDGGPHAPYSLYEVTQFEVRTQAYIYFDS